MVKAFIYIIILVSLQFFPLCPSNYAADETWDAMMDGIKNYSSDRKLREQFDALCRGNKTVLIDGRIDTGGGLYMIMDVPVYREPGKSKITELAHDAVVVLTGASNEFDGKAWQEIEFLFISAYSKNAISIDKAWVASSNLKDNS